MTEREKMTAGLAFRTGDPELMRNKSDARTLAEEYNRSPENQPEKRYEILKKLFGECGEKIMIKPPFHCDYGYNIFLGENFFANFDCVFLDLAPIRIGCGTLIGPKVQLLTAHHPFDAATRGTALEAGKPIVIGDHCWLGGGVIVCPGVTIGDRAVVGAGSVVTRDIPADSVAAGNPARIIRPL